MSARDYPALADRAFGMMVDAPLPITAERAMYFATSPDRLWKGGHANVGIAAPSTQWFHAEGATGTFFTTFLLLSNPQSTAATVTLKFLRPDNTTFPTPWPIEITKTIPPRARLTVNPAAEGNPELSNALFSTAITSNVPIVSERAMYWPGGDIPFGEGHASSGVAEAWPVWGLAEGRVGGPRNYATYILLANASARIANVRLTFLRENGPAVVKQYPMMPESRLTVDVQSMVPELKDESFGTLVESLDAPISVERSLYWNVDGRFWAGGTNAIGSVLPRYARVRPCEWGEDRRTNVQGRSVPAFMPGEECMRREVERRGWLSRQGGVRVGWLCGVVMLAALVAPSAAAASTYRWAVDANGDWNNPANWAVVEGPAGAGYPNLAGDVAVFDVAPTALRFITIPTGVTITVGRIAFDYGGDNPLVINRTGAGSFVFDNLGEDAVIESTGHGSRDISVPVQLNADLVVNGVTGSGVLMKSISESGGARNVTTTAGGLILTETNTYSGTTTVTAGTLSVTDGTTIRIPGALIVGGGPGPAIEAVASISGDSVNPLAPVTVHADGHAFFSRAFGQPNEVRIGDLSIFDGMVTLGTGGTVLSTSSLTMEGGRLLAGASNVVLIVNGAVTATSTATETALIEGIGFGSGVVNLPSATNEFIVANGPQPIDLSVNMPINGIFGGESLRKVGTGVARLNGNNIYTGATTIIAGTLLMNGTQGGGAVFVDTQGTMGGTGTVGPITAAPIGQILVGGAPGGSSRPSGVHGILRSGSVALATSSFVRFSISGGAVGSAYNQLRVTGTVNLGNCGSDRDVHARAAAGRHVHDHRQRWHRSGGRHVRRIARRRHGAAAGGAIVQDLVSRRRRQRCRAGQHHAGDVFLSEGATGTFFDEDVLIANPNTVAAPVTLTFLLPGGGTIVQQRNVPAQSRLTVRVDEIPGLEEASASVEVVSDNWPAARRRAHDVLGCLALRRSHRERRGSGAHDWLFAEGAQRLLPHLSAARQPEPERRRRDGDVPARERDARDRHAADCPRSRASRCHAGDYAGTRRTFVRHDRRQATQPITAERAMYFQSTPGRLWSGGHANTGTATPSTSWFHPGGRDWRVLHARSS